MVVLLIILIMAITYAMTFKEDFPIVLVKRTLILLLVLLAIQNINYVAKAFTSIIQGIF